VIDKRDLVKAAEIRIKDIQSDSIAKRKDAGFFTYNTKHHMNTSKDVNVHGILIDDKCHTGALIPQDLSPSDPNATPGTLSILAMENDQEFAEQCRKATMLAIHGCHEVVETQLREEMTKLPVQFHTLPFHEYIQANTPVSTIKAATERLLWYQRQGHPSDYYLFNAHWHADGVPQLLHVDCVLDICPTYIHSKKNQECCWRQHYKES